MNGQTRERILNDRPIIGILAQHTVDHLSKMAQTYVSSSNVRHLESAGCRVAVIRLFLSESEYEKIFYSINGILFPGGAVDLKSSEFARVAGIFYRLALEACDQGDYFPVWGTCLGHQLLTALTAGENLLSRTDSNNMALPLDFTDEAKSCKMFRNFTPETTRVLSETPLTGNFHKYSVTLETFKANKKLSSFYRLISTNTDRQGVAFVSTMEAFRYPIYGTQWHPEANRYFWNKSMDIPHSSFGVRISYLMAEFFVSEARKNFHHFEDELEEDSILIDQYAHTVDRTDCRIVYLF
ncbi:gamma-glutamyl hydrolase-like isoform X1 [Hemitrygon akajei]|uniref:gamma-glutamyl hydrolase-like isoform X1 n=2 Tax=Hemitrygon akajei TaxID=2704970 RepID=UPI003BF98DBB